MAWIMADQKLKDHPKTLDLMNLMIWDVDVTIGKLFRFWWWCVDYAEDGDLRKHNDARIAMAVGLNGIYGKEFVDAMVKSGWIDRDPYFRVHDWWDCIGKFLEIKYKQKPEKYQRVRMLYDGSKNIQENTTDTIKQTDKTKQVKRFTPPTLEEVSSYCQERKNSIDPQAFIDKNLSIGWVVGKNRSPMKDWKATIRTWEKNNKTFTQETQTKKRPVFFIIQEYRVLKWEKSRMKSELMNKGYTEHEIEEGFYQIDKELAVK